MRGLAPVPWSLHHPPRSRLRHSRPCTLTPLYPTTGGRADLLQVHGVRASAAFIIFLTTGVFLRPCKRPRTTYIFFIHISSLCSRIEFTDLSDVQLEIKIAFTHGKPIIAVFEDDERHGKFTFDAKTELAQVAYFLSSSCSSCSSRSSRSSLSFPFIFLLLGGAGGGAQISAHHSSPPSPPHCRFRTSSDRSPS